MMDLAQVVVLAVTAGGTGAGGAYAAVWVHLKWHKGEIAELKATQKDHESFLHELDKRTHRCESCSNLKAG